MRTQLERLILTGFIALAAALVGTMAGTSSSDARNPEELLRDRDLKKGVKVLDPKLLEIDTSGTFLVNGVVCPAFREGSAGSTHALATSSSRSQDDLDPQWRLAQWYSRGTVRPSDRSDSSEDTSLVAYNTPFKKFEIRQCTIKSKHCSTQDAVITLAVNGYEEYDGLWSAHRDVCRQRPHPILFLSQMLWSAPLDQLASLKLSFDTRLSRNDLRKSDAQRWNKKKATAHFLININVQNRAGEGMPQTVKNRVGHGQSIGIGIQVFDARGPKPELKMLELGRRRIYAALAVDATVGKQPQLGGDWVEVQDLDILPSIKRILQYAYDEAPLKFPGLKPLKSKSLSDYRITMIVAGWEVSSLHNVELSIRGLSLTQEFLEPSADTNKSSR